MLDKMYFTLLNQRLSSKGPGATDEHEAGSAKIQERLAKLNAEVKILTKKLVDTLSTIDAKIKYCLSPF